MYFLSFYISWNILHWNIFFDIMILAQNCCLVFLSNKLLQFQLLLDLILLKKSLDLTLFKKCSKDSLKGCWTKFWMSSTSPPWRPAAAKAMIAKKKAKSTNFMLIDLYFTFDNLIVAQSPYIEFFGHILTKIETFREFMENFSLELHEWNLKWNFK